MILAETLRKAVKLFPGKQAIVCGENRWTYQEFSDRLTRLARYLQYSGVRKGDKVAILHPNCHYFLEAYFGISQIGAVSVPINHRLSPQEIHHILRDSESKILIADPMFEERIEANDSIPGVERILRTGRTKDSPGHFKSHVRIGGQDRNVNYETAIHQMDAGPLSGPPIDDQDIAQIYYTSGTTGRPKGVMLSHRNVYTHALGTIAEIHLTDSDVWAHVAPLFHLADAWATWAITWVGGTHVIVRDFDPKSVFAAIEKERITTTNLIPTMLNLMVNHEDVGNYDYRSLRVLLSGGAPIAPEIVRRIIETFRCDYIQTYGMTETSPYLTLSSLKAHLRGLPQEEQLRFKAKTGREFIAVELRVVDDHGMDVAQDDREVGEIIVKGDIVTEGYWKAPVETAKSIKDGWLYTGDLATIDAEGYVTIVDRKKDMILTGGENVYSTEVENALYLHPAVLECAVIAVPDRKWGEAVKAVVVLKRGRQASEADIIRFCKDRLAHFKAPKSVEFMAALPKTGSGKILKKELRDKYWKGRAKSVN